MHQLLVIVLALLLQSCASPPPVTAPKQPDVMTMLGPLGPMRRIVQQLTVEWAQRKESILVVLELDAQHIAMSGLTLEGINLFNLQYDGNTLTSDQSLLLPLLPTAIKPEYIIADLQLAYWPTLELQKSLPVNWHLQVNKGKRRLLIGSKVLAEVNYLSNEPEWSKTVVLHNVQLNYRLYITTLSYEALSK